MSRDSLFNMIIIFLQSRFFTKRRFMILLTMWTSKSWFIIHEKRRSYENWLKKVFVWLLFLKSIENSTMRFLFFLTSSFLTSSLKLSLLLTVHITAFLTLFLSTYFFLWKFSKLRLFSFECLRLTFSRRSVYSFQNMNKKKINAFRRRRKLKLIDFVFKMIYFCRTWICCFYLIYCLCQLRKLN